MDEKRQGLKESGYGKYIITWLTLLALTTITVVVAGLQLGALSVFTAVVIAGIKANIVLNYFMHLREERPVFKMMVFVSIGTFVIFIGLTFSDILFR